MESTNTERMEQTKQPQQKKPVTVEMTMRMAQLAVLLGVIAMAAIVLMAFITHENGRVSTQIAKHVEDHQLVLNRILCDDIDKVYNVYADSCLTPEQDKALRGWMLQNQAAITKA